MYIKCQIFIRKVYFLNVKIYNTFNILLTSRLDNRLMVLTKLIIVFILPINLENVTTSCPSSLNFFSCLDKLKKP